MQKIKLIISQCRDGDMIADDILNDQGVLICPKDTVINEYIKKSLINLGIDYLWITRSSCGVHVCEESAGYLCFHKEYSSNINKLAAFTKNLLSGDDADLESFNLLSSCILKDITNNKKLVLFLNRIKKFDQSIFAHCLNVSFYSALISKWMNLSEQRTRNIIKTGLLHDLGKIQISSEILNKPDRLDPDEFEIIKDHTIHGYNILKDVVDIDSDIKLGVLMHHEREDCSGYPFGYGRREINLNSKIIAVADTYDALTSDRPYRRKATPFSAFKILQEECIASYDVSIINTFIRELAYYFIGAEVLLNTGDTGIIAHIPLHNITNPIVQINSRLVDLSKEPELCIVSMA